MQMKKGTMSTIERQKKMTMRIIFVCLAGAITFFLFYVSRGSRTAVSADESYFMLGHHSNPFNTSTRSILLVLTVN
jgi:hypothetical protein